MTADRPSREYRLEHMPDGERVLMPVTDPPEAAPEKPADDSERPPRHPWAPAAKVALVATILGSGGIGALVQPAISWAREGAEQRRQVDALTDRVSELTGAVNRLTEAQVRTEKAVEHIKGRLEPIANLRGQISEASSYLAREPRPDVESAREVLDE